MADRKGALWYLVNGGMELCWFLAWAMFLSTLTLHRPFPFFETVAAFALAAAITRLSTGRGWLVVTVLAAQAVGFACGGLLLIHGIDYGSYPLGDGAWLTAFLDASRDVWQWLILILNAILFTILWTLGATLARRSTGYLATRNRFDLGLGAFFALFIIKLIALTKGAEAMADDPFSLLFLFPFFLFGLLSIGMERMRRSAGARAFLPGFRGGGVILSFVAAVLIATGGALLFLLPGLTAAAQVGYSAMTAIGRPLLPVLIAVLRFVFGPRAVQQIEAAAKSGRPSVTDQLVTQAQPWWMAWLTEVLSWGVWGLMMIVLAAAAAIALVCVVKWLLSRTRGESPPATPFSLRLGALRALLAGGWERLLCGIRGYPAASELYGALCRWAGRSGLAHDRSETPLEFGRRLHDRFPGLKPPIDLIVASYNREVYGETTLSGPALAEANAAWRFLRSPRRWPARMKGWFGVSPAG